jgi:hypothetical protein
MPLKCGHYKYVDSWCNDTDGGKRKNPDKPVPVTLSPLQIPHELTHAQTRASVVRGQRLIA